MNLFRQESYQSNNGETVPACIKICKFSPDGRQRIYSLVDEGDALEMVSSGEAVLYDSQDAMEEALQYASDRRNNYPAIEEQLDQIYHEGIDAWQETIQAVKDAHPKPE